MIKKTDAKKATKTLLVPEPHYETVEVEIIFKAPLLQGQMSPRTVEALAHKGEKAITGRAPIDPTTAFEECRHVIDANRGMFGHPAVAFWHAMVEASSLISANGNRLVKLGKAFAVYGYERGGLSLITDARGKPLAPVMHTRVAIPQKGGAVLVYAAKYDGARTRILIEYDADVLTQVDVIRLLKRAGSAVGVGVWRITCKKGGRGTFGSFDLGQVIHRKAA